MRPDLTLPSLALAWTIATAPAMFAQGPVAAEPISTADSTSAEAPTLAPAPTPDWPSVGLIEEPVSPFPEIGLVALLKENPPDESGNESNTALPSELPSELPSPRNDDLSGLRLMLLEGPLDTGPSEGVADEEVESTLDGETDEDILPAPRPADPETIPPPPSDSSDSRSAGRIAELQKPSSELNIRPPVMAAGEVPANRAAEWMDQPARSIVGELRPIERADRVHIRFCHQPTYYQELNLERCGRTDCPSMGCLQNAYSSFWFVLNTGLLPYRLASQPHCQCVSAYGDCGVCQEYECPIEPICAAEVDDRCRGLLGQAAAAAGFAFLIL